jgi:hypothetical protein
MYKELREHKNNLRDGRCVAGYVNWQRCIQLQPNVARVFFHLMD